MQQTETPTDCKKKLKLSENYLILQMQKKEPRLLLKKEKQILKGNNFDTSISFHSIILASQSVHRHINVQLQSVDAFLKTIAWLFAVCISATLSFNNIFFLSIPFTDHFLKGNFIFNFPPCSEKIFTSLAIPFSFFALIKNAPSALSVLKETFFQLSGTAGKISIT